MYQDSNGFRVNGYDFFGLFAPGVLVLVPVLICSVQIKYSVGLVGSLRKMINATNDLKNFQFIVISIIATIAAYIIGHIVASISATFFEKTIVGKILRYPFNSIIFGTKSKRDFSGYSYRSFAVLFYVTVFSFVMGARLPDIEGPLKGLSHVSFCCVFGSLFSALIVLKILDAPYSRLQYLGYRWYHKFIFGVFLFFGSPFLVVEKFIVSFLGQMQSFPEEIRTDLRKKYKKVFGRRIKKRLSTEVFWSIYWYTTNNSPYIRKKTDSWLVQYGFMRNLSFASLASSVILVLPSRFGVTPSDFLNFAAILLFVLSLVFAFRYYYLYFGYYS
ncbi:MAG: hypothetical protein AB7E32_08655 [Desulfovibrio sp.]